jgi:hypothetical protein
MPVVISFEAKAKLLPARSFRRIAEMERRYRLTCPECGNKFWAERELIKTSGFDGSLKGFRCPQKGCGAIVPWERKR